MKGFSRVPLTLFTLAFGYYHAALGLFSIADYTNPVPIIFGVLLYVAALSWAMLQRPDLHLSDLATAFALVVAGVLPILGAMSIGEPSAAGYSTWYIAGVGTLMAVLAVRQRPLIASIGTAIMVTEVLLWGGPGILFGSGIVGALLIVFAALGASRGLASSYQAAASFRARALSVDAEREANEAARKLVKARARLTLDTALPLLELIEKKQGLLTKAETKKVLMAEAALRDGIRGKSLISDEMVAAVQSARSRGVEVQLLDDGGFDKLAAKKRQEITARVSQELSTLTKGKVVIRSTTGEKWTVTMVALQPGADAPDIFLRL